MKGSDTMTPATLPFPTVSAHFDRADIIGTRKPPMLSAHDFDILAERHRATHAKGAGTIIQPWCSYSPWEERNRPSVGEVDGAAFFHLYGTHHKPVRVLVSRPMEGSGKRYILAVAPKE